MGKCTAPLFSIMAVLYLFAHYKKCLFWTWLLIHFAQHSFVYKISLGDLWADFPISADRFSGLEVRSSIGRNIFTFCCEHGFMSMFMVCAIRYTIRLRVIWRCHVTPASYLFLFAKNWHIVEYKSFGSPFLENRSFYRRTSFVLHMNYFRSAYLLVGSFSSRTIAPILYKSWFYSKYWILIVS